MNIKSQEVDLKTLIDTKYIKTVHDSGNGKLCEDKVIVTIQGDSQKYKGCLKCSNYVTEGCS